MVRVPAALALVCLLGPAASSSSSQQGAGRPSSSQPPAADGVEIDQNLYSRQLYTIGRDAQLRVSQSRVIIAGLRATGAEVAKNLVLAGIRVVSLHDDSPVGWSDLSGNYCLDEQSIGRSRAHACRAMLAALNPEHVDVLVHDGPITRETLASSTVLIAADLDHAEELRLNELCRSAGVHFVSTCGRGVFGRVFCDFAGGTDGEAGDEDGFAVEDTDGEPVREVHIHDIRGDGTVELADPTAVHGISRGDRISFADVGGMPGLCVPERTFLVQRVRGRRALEIDRDALLAACAGQVYSRGGIARRVKSRAHVRFQSLALASRQVPLRSLHTDGRAAAPRREATVHACFCALRTEEPGMGVAEGTQGTDEGLAAFLALARAFARERRAVSGSSAGVADDDDDDGWDEALATTFWRQARVCIRPMAALLGGLAAAECVKACTHRWSPLCQFLYYDDVDCLPSTTIAAEARAGEDAMAGAVSSEEGAAAGVEAQAAGADRHSGQRLVLGDELTAALGRLRVFIVGAGAIGCELLKNLAGMHVGLEGLGGSVSLTDNDLIERSNLNRQLLFRAADIGKPKAQCAAEACARLAPGMALRPHVLKLDAETTSPRSGAFGEAFWRSHDLVTTALDNVAARLLVDELSVRFGLPMLDSGTLGAKGSVQTSMPGVTQSYGASADPAEAEGAEIPQCTLKSFPFAPEHCVAWAREQFESEFAVAIAEAVRFLKDEEAFVLQFVDSESAQGVDTEALGEALGRVVRTLEGRPTSLDECVSRALSLFQRQFDSAVRELLSHYPETHVDEDGRPFWRGSKRRPKALRFELSDPAHTGLVRAAARLYAESFGLPVVAAELASSAGDAPFAQAVDRAMAARALEPARASSPAGESGAAAAQDSEGAEGAEGAGGGGGSGGGSSDERAQAEAEAYLARADTLRESLVASGLRLQPAEFEKDDDANGHLAFVLAASNCRCDCYSIARLEWMACKQLAGRIVPAIATTTSVVAALVCFELIKVARLMVERDRLPAPERARHAETGRAALRNTYVNLALPLLASTEPLPPMRRGLHASTGLEGLTEWDSLHVEADAAGDGSVASVVAQIESLLGGARVLALTCADGVLFSALLPCAFEPASSFGAALKKLRPYVHEGPDGLKEVRLGVSAVGEGEAGEQALDVPQLVYRWRGPTVS